MIFGLCDESFAINSTISVPNHVDKGWVMFFVTLLNHVYWVVGATLVSKQGFTKGALMRSFFVLLKNQQYRLT